MGCSVHTHWEFDSVCPHCQKLNHVTTSVGNHVIRVHCEHCIHGYEYTHIVADYKEVEDESSIIPGNQ
jgi:Zn ribbon nucleic-acid-binding protein